MNADIPPTEEEWEPPPTPFLFKLTLAAAAAYLLLRVAQMVGWLIDWLG